jgi:hypothetical protein
MGLSETTTLNFEFFQQYLKTDHGTVQKKALALLKDKPAPPLPTVAAAGTAPAPASPVAAKSAGAAASLNAAASTPVSASAPAEPAAAPTGDAPFVYVTGVQGKGSIHRRGQPFEIDVAVDRDTNLYCFLLDENRRVNQFFPNPAQPNAAVKGGTRMQFPGNLPFRFVASTRGAQESIACFAAPSALGTEPLKGVTVAGSTDELKAVFRQVGGPRIGVGVYDVKIQ